MTEMVLDVVDIGVHLSEGFGEEASKLEHAPVVTAALLATPLRSRPEEPGALEKNRDRMADPVAQHPRAPVVSDVIDLSHRDPGIRQTGADRFPRETDVVFLSGEPLFFRGMNEPAVPKECRG